MIQAEDKSNIDAFSAGLMPSHYAPVRQPLHLVSGRRWNGSTTPDAVRPKWATPQWLVDWLSEKYTAKREFDLDVAAEPVNAKAINYYTKEQNGLASPWDAFGNDVFCNPPYDDIMPWVEKAVAECKRAKHLTVCMVLPNDISTAWFRHACINAAEIVNLISDGKSSGRVAFVDPVTGETGRSNNKGTTLFIFKSKKKCSRTLYLSRADMESAAYE